MHGKVVIVTGATNGIGAVCALELARKGATVVLISRSQSRLDAQVELIKTATDNPNVSAIEADLSSLAGIHHAANRFLEQHSRLDVLVNNAGAVFNSRQESIDGNEMTLALNHLNYFLLSHLLLDILKQTASKAGEARIVNVSSAAHEGVAYGIDFADIQRRNRYNSWQAYSESKLMNILFTHELARRVKDSKVMVNVLHPGFVNTGFGRNNEGWFKWAITAVQNVFAISSEKGAETMIYLASSPDVKGITGQYWYLSQPKEPKKIAYDETIQAKLWEVSEELCRIPSKV